MGDHCRQERGMCGLATRSERKWRMAKEHVDRVWKVYQRWLDGELVAGGMLQIWKRLRRLWRRWHWVVPPESWQLRRVWRMDGRRCSPAQLSMKLARFFCWKCTDFSAALCGCQTDLKVCQVYRDQINLTVSFCELAHCRLLASEGGPRAHVGRPLVTQIEILLRSQFEALIHCVNKA